MFYLDKLKEYFATNWNYMFKNLKQLTSEKGALESSLYASLTCILIKYMEANNLTKCTVEDYLKHAIKNDELESIIYKYWLPLGIYHEVKHPGEPFEKTLRYVSKLLLNDLKDFEEYYKNITITYSCGFRKRESVDSF